jgi:3-dehydroquinate synthase
VIRVPVRLRRTVDDSHDIRIGRGLGPRISVDLRRRPVGQRYIIVTDSSIHRRYGSPLLAAFRRRGLKTDLVAFPAGEASKTRRVRDLLEDRIIALGTGRDAAIVALGGGVVGDLAGFVAATFNRGIPFIQIPTTLVGMVDSAIGGKTGINHPAGKNFIGAFQQPAAIYIDVDYLKTLPAPHFNSGMAEVVKSGAIADSRLFGTLERHLDRVMARDPDTLSRVIEACCRIKVRVVASDPRESNRRQVLNFGHTIGHALESLARYRMVHGEAVSIGMVAEARLAQRLGFLSATAVERIETLLRRIGLPVRIPARFRPRDIVAAAHRDKKARAGKVTCALPVRIGAMASIEGDYGILLADRMVLQMLADHGGA